MLANQPIVLMLSLHFTRQQLRRTASVALFAWVFALLSGVANACLIQPNAAGEAAFGRLQGTLMAEATAEAAPTDRQVEHARHHAADESGGPDKDGGKAGCLKFCADETSALAKNKASYADLPGLTLMASAHWQLATPVAAVAPWHPGERPASVGPPLFLRLLRLTI